jgi:hypothetical protein
MWVSQMIPELESVVVMLEVAHFAFCLQLHSHFVVSFVLVVLEVQWVLVLV